jgi:hypothetical protein
MGQFNDELVAQRLADNDNVLLKFRFQNDQITDLVVKEYKDLILSLA